MIENKKILIIQTAFIGDVVLTLPLIEAAHRKFPGSMISLLIIPGAYDLVKANPYLDDVIVYDKKGKDRGFKNFLELVQKIKSGKYDLAVLPHRSLRSAMLVFLSGIPERIGFNRGAGKMLLTKVVKYSWNKHDVERNLDLIEGRGEALPRPRKQKIPIFLDEEDIKAADKFLKSPLIPLFQRGKEGDCLLIGIAPGSVWATKRWLKEKFAELIKKLAEEYKTRIILFGGEEDEALAYEIRKLSNCDLIVAAGKLSLGESASAISKCRIFITNDTAPLHLASAFQVSTVAIFGPTTANLGFGPYGTNYLIVEKKLECRPCGKHGHKQCPKGHFKCMKEIAADEVFGAVSALLN
ncbi:MAG: lipopolysaccharide heptosyltransferase II [bacterium]